MTTTPRRAREIARTRRDILEAAARAFVQNGYKVVTMQEIAKEAGYTAASLYSYFSSKEEILQGLRDLILEEMDAVFEAPIPDGLTLRQKLELLLRRQLAAGKRRFELVALLHLGGPAPESEKIMEIHSRRCRLYEDFLTFHSSSEERGGHEIQDVSLMLCGIGNAFFSHWILEPKERWLDEKLTVMLDVLFDGLVPRILDKTPGS